MRKSNTDGELFKMLKLQTPAGEPNISVMRSKQSTSTDTPASMLRHSAQRTAGRTRNTHPCRL